jgi:Protein of unknown function (DUF2934)
MANRRVSDSEPSSRSGLPPPALADVKAAKPTPPTPAKKSAKRTTPAPAPSTAGPSEAAATSAAKARKRRPAADKAQALIAATPAPTVTEDERRGLIAYSAYLRAERRGFAPGGEAEDWLAAEKEVDALLSHADSAAQ